MHLEVFTDFVCPWCYLGTSRLERLRDEIDFEVEWVYFPLHPETPASGLTLEALFAGRNMDIETMLRRLYGLFEAEGLPYGKRTHTFNSRLAQELAKWADRSGAAGLHRALYEAYFVDGRNLAEIDVLVDVAESSGLGTEDTRRVLEDRTFRDAVDADWEKARRYGVTSVPTFVLGRRGMAGAQPVDLLRSFVTEGLRQAGSAGQ
jgi:predicted DsbA family dithiol-disulfide isomerase